MNPTRRAAFTILCCLPLATLLMPMAAHAATQGSGKAATETRPVPEFQAIGLAGSMDLRVSQGATQSVTVQADDNLLPLLETVVEDGKSGPTLQVRWKRGQSIYTRAKVQVTVVTPRLTALAAAGAGNIKVESFTTPALQLSISGAGDAKLEGLSTDDLGVRISGSGDVSGSGKASKLKVSIAGSGDVRLAALRADDVQVSIAGSGDAAVYADKTLDVHIAGSGDVTYTGNAALKSSVAGSGSVKRK
jgi:hypothetical protein